MIERVWSARTTKDGAVAYTAYFRRVVMPELAAVTGYRGVRLLHREIEGAIELVVASLWESLDVIRGFAGEDIDQAVVHDEAAALFTDYERTAKHFEVVVGDVGVRNPPT